VNSIFSLRAHAARKSPQMQKELCRIAAEKPAIRLMQ
jgi:hypothetical protein